MLRVDTSCSQNLIQNKPRVFSQHLLGEQVGRESGSPNIQIKAFKACS